MKDILLNRIGALKVELNRVYVGGRNYISHFYHYLTSDKKHYLTSEGEYYQVKG